MSYSKDEVNISNALTELNDKVSFTFNFKGNSLFNGLNKISIDCKIILDIVYLKKEISLFKKEYPIENGIITVDIDDFKMDNEDESTLLNISKLQFDFINNGNLIDAKNLIIQPVQEKNKIYKHII